MDRHRSRYRVDHRLQRRPNLRHLRIMARLRPAQSRPHPLCKRLEANCSSGNARRPSTAGRSGRNRLPRETVRRPGKTLEKTTKTAARVTIDLSQRNIPAKASHHPQYSNQIHDSTFHVLLRRPPPRPPPATAAANLPHEIRTRSRRPNSRTTHAAKSSGRTSRRPDDARQRSNAALRRTHAHHRPADVPRDFSTVQTHRTDDTTNNANRRNLSRIVRVEFTTTTTPRAVPRTP